MYKKSLFTLLTVFAFVLGGCGSGGETGGKSADSGKKEYKDQVVIHNLSDPEGLHPCNVSDANATEIRRYLMQKLMNIDYSTLELVPWMAAKKPEVEVIGDNKAMKITYELREGLTWDDGKPITPRDVEFSFMVILNEKVDAGSIRPYVEDIADFVYYEDNPLKFSFVWDGVYMLWDHVTGNDVWIVPEHKYDPQGLMKNYKIKDFPEKSNDDNAVAFAKDFNDVKYHRTADLINGSGPYKLTEWVTDQRIVMERKDNWMGSKFKGQSMCFEDGPRKIVFETVNDMTTALTALKAERLDVMNAIRPSDWVKLDDSDKFTKNYNKSNPDMPYYSYVGMHIKDKKLADKKTRQALAHVVDVDNINKQFLHGLKKRIVGPISPALKDDYHSELKLYPYDLEKAKSLLKEAGWEDTNGNGTVDKMIDGERVEFTTTFNYNQGNDTRKNVGLAMKEAARQVGVDIEVAPLEWSVYLERLKEHKIPMFYGAWVFDPRPSDPKQIWHTESYNGGSNYTGFGDAASDQLIDDIRSELDPAKRSALYKKWQELLHDEAAYIFLYTGGFQNGIHKRFTNLNEGARDPGYWGGGLQLAAGFSNTAN